MSSRMLKSVAPSSARSFDGATGVISVLCSSDLSIEFPCPSVGVFRSGQWRLQIEMMIQRLSGVGCWICWMLLDAFWDA